MPASQYASVLKDKVAIVTGAASGMGKLLVEQLVACGAQVLLVDISPTLQQLADELNSRREKSAEWLTCDLCQTQTIQEALECAVGHFGHVDIVVNNAGIINKASLFQQPDHADLERVMRVNLIAPMEGTRIAVRYFQSTGRRGVILNTASVAGLTPTSFMETYGTSKAGLLFFTAACKDLAPLVRVNAVAPYFVDTPLVSGSAVLNERPMLLKFGMLQPEQVVDAMLQAICDESLAGDTLVVYSNRDPVRLTMYDDQALSVVSGIAMGVLGKLHASVGRVVSAISRKVMG
ncbi:hypothetical protein IWQ56_000056 [Coemansia nantahalensis]|nr:hypothetical protein IWQ56_000056 [Coemansia nantahalensis]